MRTTQKPYRFEMPANQKPFLVILDDKPERVAELLPAILDRGWPAGQIKVLVVNMKEDIAEYLYQISDLGAEVFNDASYHGTLQHLTNLRGGVFACDGRLFIPRWPSGDERDDLEGSEIISRFRVELGSFTTEERIGHWLMGVWSDDAQNFQSKTENIPWWPKRETEEFPSPPSQ